MTTSRSKQHGLEIEFNLELLICKNINVGNGNNYSDDSKIFQPFFNTKPTGQGTGLGLSLSYDIIKSHNGELSVTSDVGEGTESKIILNNQ